jgi:RNA polymerase sigma-70 factor (ECF subfamily)
MSGGDDVTVERAKRGDREAFAALVRKHQRRVYQTAFHITGNHGDADDVAQEAFIRAHRGLAGFDGRADFFTWLYRIVVNVALNHVRARKRHAETSLEAGGLTERTRPAIGADPARQAEARAETRRVLEALAQLSPTLRVTLVLAAVEEMPYKQIALAMECPEGTVAWRVNQARKLLRQKLADVALAEEIDTDELLRRAKHAAAAP